MKIIFVTTGDIQSIATSKRALGMASPLSSIGYHVSIILEDTLNNRLRVKQEAPNVNTLWFSSCRALEELREKKKLIRKNKPDLIYISALGIRNMIWSWGIEKKSCFLIEHSELASSIKNQPILRRILSFLFEKLSLILFQGHIVASRYLENYITKSLSQFTLSRSVLYSPYAFSPSMLIIDKNTSKNLKERIQSRKVLVYMGTLSSNYGILDIIDAVETLRKNIPNILLLVLGKGRDAGKAKAIIEQKKLETTVYLEGYVSDKNLPSYLEHADAFIAPLYNTVQDIARCPSKLFLYLPYNRPIVTCKLGEAKSLLGDYPYYFTSGNLNDMVRVLNEALSVEDDWIAPWDANKHTWEHRAIEFDEWVKSLLSKNKKRE